MRNHGQNCNVKRFLRNKKVLIAGHSGLKDHGGINFIWFRGRIIRSF